MGSLSIITIKLGKTFLSFSRLKKSQSVHDYNMGSKRRLAFTLRKIPISILLDAAYHIDRVTFLREYQISVGSVSLTVRPFRFAAEASRIHLLKSRRRHSCGVFTA